MSDKWIVTTSVEENESGARFPRHTAQYEIEVNREEIELILQFNFGIDRDQIISARHLQRVTSIIEETNLGICDAYY